MKTSSGLNGSCFGVARFALDRTFALFLCVRARGFTVVLLRLSFPVRRFFGLVFLDGIHASPRTYQGMHQLRVILSNFRTPLWLNGAQG